MLLLLTWASLTISVPSFVHPTLAASDTVKFKEHDSLNSKDRGNVRIRPSPFLHNAPFTGIQTDKQDIATAIDTLLRNNPILRGPLLKEILIPSTSLTQFSQHSVQDLFNQGLERDSKFTPFERMSLIAKRYAIDNTSDRSLKSYQLDILRTIHWWFDEVFK